MSIKRVSSASRKGKNRIRRVHSKGCSNRVLRKAACYQPPESPHKGQTALTYICALNDGYAQRRAHLDSRLPRGESRQSLSHTWVACPTLGQSSLTMDFRARPRAEPTGRTTLGYTGGCQLTQAKAPLLLNQPWPRDTCCCLHSPRTGPRAPSRSLPVCMGSSPDLTQLLI